MTVQQTTCASGTASASRPSPLRARMRAPEAARAFGEDADAGAAAQRLDRARERADVARPRSIGIWPMPLSTMPTGLNVHSEDLASAWIWRRERAASPIAIGSQ